MVCAVLAGGENSRLPATKAFVELGGKRLIESAIDTLSGLFDRVVISTNEPEKYFYLGVPLVGDVYPQRGPMGGIFSVLLNIAPLGDEEAFFVACDMPFISPALIGLLQARLKEAKIKAPPHDALPYDAIVPMWRKGPEPLFAFYSVRAMGEMERGILRGTSGLQGFLSASRVLYIGREEVEAVDPHGLSFVNINTREDYEKAVAMTRVGHGR